MDGDRPLCRRWQPYAEAGVEPSLEELLRDPITHRVMARDRITEADVLEAVRQAMIRLRRPPVGGR